MSDFAEDVIEELLERTAKGEQLVKLCSDPRMPSRSSVYSWLDTDQQFAGRFRAARAQGIHALAEECLDIADEEAADAVVVANKRVRIDTRLRLAGKWLPSAYGEKLDLTSGGDKLPGASIDVTGLSEAALRELAALGVKEGE